MQVIDSKAVPTIAFSGTKEENIPNTCYISLGCLFVYELPYQSLKKKEVFLSTMMGFFTFFGSVEKVFV